MCKVIAVAVRKGGAGKTTTACNLAVALARRTGQPVLLIDIDSQGNLTRSVGVDKRELRKTVSHLLLDQAASLDELIVRTEWGVDIIPADRNLAAGEQELRTDPIDPNTRLRYAIEPLRERYGHIVIDCPPSLGPLTINALTAADEVLLPFEANALGAEGITETLDTISRVRKRLNPRLKIAGFVVNRYDARLSLARDVVQKTREAFGGKVRVFRTIIKATASLQEAPGHGTPAAFYKSRNPSHAEAVAAYDALAAELLGGEEASDEQETRAVN